MTGKPFANGIPLGKTVDIGRDRILLAPDFVMDIPSGKSGVNENHPSLKTTLVVYCFI